jgi:hypothetical protein
VSFDINHFHAELALFSINKENYIKTVAHYVPELQGWPNSFQKSLEGSPLVKSLHDQAKALVHDPDGTQSLFDALKNNTDDRDLTSQRMLVHVVIGLLHDQKHDLTSPFEKVVEAPPQLDKSSHINDSNLFNNQPAYQAIFNI